MTGRCAAGHRLLRAGPGHQPGDRRPPRRECTRLGNLGSAYGRPGRCAAGHRYHEQALAIRREIGDRRRRGHEPGQPGDRLRQLGDAQRAIGYFEQALVIAARSATGGARDTALVDLGNAYRRLGDARRAIGYFEQALAIRREIGDRMRRGRLPDRPGEHLPPTGRRPAGHWLLRAGPGLSARDRRPPRRGRQL